MLCDLNMEFPAERNLHAKHIALLFVLFFFTREGTRCLVLLSSGEVSCPSYVASMLTPNMLVP